MLFTSWLQNSRSSSPSSRAGRNRCRSLPFRAATRSRPRLESLEDRTLLSTVSFSPPVSYGVGSGPAPMAVGDFNGDGKPDIAVANENSNTVSVLLGNSDGTFQSAHSLVVGTDPESLAVGDFNGDGKPDIAVANASSNTVSVLLGNGDGTFQSAQSLNVGNRPVGLTAADFNGDRKPDLVLTNALDNTVSVLLGNGDGTFRITQYPTGGIYPSSVVVGDFNGDGKADLADNGGVLLGNGNGTFQSASGTYFGFGDAESLAIADFNGDGKPDLLATYSNYYANLLLGNGDGQFQSTDYFRTGSSVAIADFNGDGKPDVAAADAGDNYVDLMMGDGAGGFQSSQRFAFDPGTFPFRVTVGDFNGDGKPDLAVANPFSDTISVALNAYATTTSVSGPASSTYAQAVTYIATVTSGAAPVTVGTVTFIEAITHTILSPALALNANGQVSFSTASLPGVTLAVEASYSGTPGGAGTTGLGASVGFQVVTVNPLPLTVTAVNFNATAGAPFVGTIASFINPDPFGTAASYTATIDWGDGTTSTGTITGTGTLAVTGSHTYADPGIDAVSVQISHNLGNTTTATVYPTANVTTLGQDVQHGLTGGIGFWHGKNGQALINSFNGGSNATALSTWLASAFTNLYGAGAGANNLTGETNNQLAAFYQSQFALSGSNLEAEVVATALNVYATTQSLGGTIGQAYGFTVSADGLGADSFNVGADGAAFGVANNTTLNVYEMLEAVDRQSVYGVLYNGDTTLRKEANGLFDALNKAGSIS